MRARASVLVFLLGCGAAPVAPASSPSSTPVADACADATGLVVEPPAEIPASWDGALTVGGSAPVIVRWCGAGTVAIDRVTVDATNGGQQEYTFDTSVTRLAHGESARHDVRGSPVPDDVVITAYAIDDTSRSITAQARTHSVLDPAFIAARDRCVTTGGTFAPFGMAQRYACDQPTHDAGRRCLSSGDCESACIDDHTEVTNSPPDGRACAAGEEVRLHVGSCASRSILFGCSARLDAVLTECTAPGAATRQHTVCVD